MEALNSGRGRDKPSESVTKGQNTNDSKEQSDSDTEPETRPATTFSDSLFTQDQLSTLTLEQKMLIGAYNPRPPKRDENEI